jgi:hypothetical protein
MEILKETLGQIPETLAAYAGYGSEQNYEYLENNGVEAFVKFNNFDKEKTKKWKENPFRFENLHYNQGLDYFYCPMGQAMTFVRKKVIKSEIGYIQIIRCYQVQNCNGCPIFGNIKNNQNFR